MAPSWLLSGLAAPFFLIASAQDELDCKLVLSGDLAFEDRWYHTPAGRGPRASSLARVVRGRPFTTLIFFRNPATDASGERDVLWDLTVTAPDGATYHESKDMLAKRGRYSGPNVRLGDTNFRISFEPEDLAGEYRFHATVRDAVTKKTAEAEATILLIEPEEPSVFSSKEEFGEWMKGYYDAPTPDRAIEGLLFASRNGLTEEPGTFMPVFSFFREVFELNPYLYPRLLDRFEDLEPDVHPDVLYLLARSTYDSTDFVAGLEGDTRELHAKLAEMPFPNPLEEALTDPSHLDVLWGSFLATGRFAPVRRLLEVVQDGEPDRAEADAARRRVLYGAAKWSLRSNVRQHTLVRDYCQWVLENEELSEAAKGELEELLSE